MGLDELILFFFKLCLFYSVEAAFAAPKILGDNFRFVISNVEGFFFFAVASAIATGV